MSAARITLQPRRGSRRVAVGATGVAVLLALAHTANDAVTAIVAVRSSYIEDLLPAPERGANPPSPRTL